MKKTFLTFAILLIACVSFSADWIDIHSTDPAPASIELIASTVEESSIHFSLDGFYLNEVETPRGTANTIQLNNGTNLLVKGAPDLLKLTASVIIPDMARMEVNVVNSSYTEYKDIEIAPSKGNFTRDIDPASVPYTYGKVYETDRFYPGELAELRDPYILRDYRGQTVVVYPFQYNPLTKVLRVYHDITVEVNKIDDNGVNPFIRTNELTSINTEFSRVYQRHFLNNSANRYDPITETGNMLIISHGDFISAVEPLADWRIKTGMPVEIVDVATIGNNATAIKDYIADYYTDNGLAFVLLVGDAAQVTSSYSNGDSDVDYSYISGNDHYPEILIGRFSAENEAQVMTQVTRTLEYEQNPVNDGWLKRSLGIGSAEGPGDDNEYDYEHLRNLQADHLAFTYNWNAECFDGSQGGNDGAGNPSPSDVASEVETGVSVINYTGHGSNTTWVSSGFSNSDVNGLENTGKLPFIWDVACVNGNFVGLTCFAEAWMRATYNDQPSGAIAVFASTINQSWNPPMCGQDEMTDILVESYTNNIKRTFGGLSFNGCLQMNDEYGGAGDEMTDTWHVFGDPALMVRTDSAASMTVTYNPAIMIGVGSFVVNCDIEDALVALTLDGNIIGTANVSGGSATITFDPFTNVGTADVVVTAFNCLPYIGTVDIIPAAGPFIVYESHAINDAAGNNNGVIDYTEDILLSISLENVGVDPANGVIVTISTTDPYITLTDNTEDYGTIAAGQTATVTDGFAFTAANDIPDNHQFMIEISAEGSSKELWMSSFSETAFAPVLQYITFSIDDASGNGNGKIDPGETVELTIEVANNGSSDAYDVNADLTTVSDHITIDQGAGVYGDLAIGASNTAVFTITAEAATPAGHTAGFDLAITGEHGINGNGNFFSVVGQIPVLLINFDQNTSSSDEMMNCFENLGVASEDMDAMPENLGLYQSIFVCLGVYPENHVLTSTQGDALAEYLNNGGRLYLEGGDTWFYDSQTAVHDMFEINATNDGSGDLSSVNGQPGSIAEGFNFDYSGENNYIDHINPTGTAISMFKSNAPVYGTAVMYDEGTYRTVGASFEFGGLDDNENATKDMLMAEILYFFGVDGLYVNIADRGLANSLHTNYPNPFSAHTTIGFELQESTHVNIEIYNLNGQKITTLVDEVKASGLHQVVWNVEENIPGGIYFYQFNDGIKTVTKKMILMK